MDYMTRSSPQMMQLPPHLAQLQRQLEVSMARSQGTALAFQSVMGEVSNVFDYGFTRAVQSVVMAGLLRQAASMQGALSPAVERELDNMLSVYLRSMTATQQAAAHYLLQLAGEVAAGKASPDSLRAQIQRLLKG